jgi:hypothetical protein
MAQGAWKTAYASAIGTSHAKTGAPCQDAGFCILVHGAGGAEFLVAAVADGAGTASRSEAGANRAVDLFIRAFGEAASVVPDIAAIDRGFVERWVARAKAEIGAMAADEGHDIRDFACTLLGAVVGPAGAVYVQIGDGAIIASGATPGEYQEVFWPQHGEFANTTNFLTQDNAEAVLETADTKLVVNEIALFSDGIERLVLDFANRTVHAPAFRPIFNWLAGTPPGASAEPSAALAAYLASEPVNRRTDDDKTLVMATRLPAPTRPA